LALPNIQFVLRTSALVLADESRLLRMSGAALERFSLARWAARMAKDINEGVDALWKSFSVTNLPGTSTACS